MIKTIKEVMRIHFDESFKVTDTDYGVVMMFDGAWWNEEREDND